MAVDEPTFGESNEPAHGLDRRDLLKKAVVGGAIAWAAPVVLTSPAFADGGTQKCKPTVAGSAIEFTFTVVGGYVTVSVATGVPSCPCGGGATLQYRWSVSSPAVVRTDTPPISTIASGGALSSFVPLTTVRITNAASSTTLADGTYSLRCLVRFSCVRFGTQYSWICLERTQSFTKTGGSVTPTGSPGTGTPSSDGDCGTPP